MQILLLRAVVVCLFIGGLPALRAQPAATGGMSVWAISGNVRVDPITGTAKEDNREVFPGGLGGDYRSENVIWNGGEKRITLHAARNEIVSFQIVVDRESDEPLEDVSVALGEFRGPGGNAIPAVNVDLYKEWYVRIRQPSAGDYSLGTGWYPDALLPTEDWEGLLYPRDYILPFDIPDVMNNIGEKQRSHALWVDIYIPRDRGAAPPGTYNSTVTVTSSAGSVRLKAELEVWDFALPDETHLAGNIHSDTEINTFPDKLELKYYQMIRRHRLALGVLGYAPEIETSGTDVRFDWTEYDARLGKYLDGSAFTPERGYHGPGEGVPTELLVLPFDYEPMNVYKTSRGIQTAGKEFKFYRAWPVSLPEEGVTKEYSEIFSNAFRGFQQHFEDNQWNKTRPIVFFLSLDEAYDRPSWEQMLFYAKLLESSGADRLEFRIDGWYPPEAMELLAPYLDIAILGGQVDTERIGGLREAGVEDWFYTGVGNIDQDPLAGRALSWFCWKYGISSWTLWELDFNSLRAWLFPESYRSERGAVHNGHGMLVYRGETMGLAEPAASIRLKMLRRGAQDYEYLWLLSQTPEGKAEADRVANALVLEEDGKPGSWGAWERNAEEWERARIQIGDWIDER